MIAADTVQRPEARSTDHLLLLAQHVNMHFVTPNLAVGGGISGYTEQLATRQMHVLAQLGVTHVIDCRIEWDDTELFAENHPEIGYLHHEMDDRRQDVPVEWLNAAIDFIEARLHGGFTVGRA